MAKKNEDTKKVIDLARDFTNLQKARSLYEANGDVGAKTKLLEVADKLRSYDVVAINDEDWEKLDDSLKIQTGYAIWVDLNARELFTGIKKKGFLKGLEKEVIEGLLENRNILSSAVGTEAEAMREYSNISRSERFFGEYFKDKDRKAGSGEYELVVDAAQEGIVKEIDKIKGLGSEAKRALASLVMTAVRQRLYDETELKKYAKNGMQDSINRSKKVYDQRFGGRSIEDTLETVGLRMAESNPTAYVAGIAEAVDEAKYRKAA